ncbi:hypothetical protein MYP_660 [Sporocytophaga myxococcoides]|uniref:Uncharacterized protein n=1 Tax=Sporocytophaga myxococcoides TaxID=153721 RepID=A0A098LB76_9BACT|nr:hypothetical protein MYP_660 [Sporocytophaga myxococcoides]
MSDSGMLQPIKKRAYAEGIQLPEQSGGPEPEEIESESQTETEVDVAAEHERDSESEPVPDLNSHKKASRFEIPDSPEMTFDKREEVLDTSENAPPVIDQAAKQAANSTADWIWNNFENITPEILHQTTKIDETRYDESGIDIETLNLIKDTISRANVNNKESLKIKSWHKDNIYPPLKEWLQENGMDVKVPAWAKLLIGVVIVAGMLWMSVKEVNASNRFLLRNLDRRLEDLKKKKQDPE